MTERTDITPILVDEERRAAREAIIEAAARALQKFLGVDSSDIPSRPWLSQAEAVLAAVAPLIRAAALEEAAVVAEEFSLNVAPGATRQIATAIRALIVTSPLPPDDSA
jgi:hypothetical protein